LPDSLIYNEESVDHSPTTPLLVHPRASWLLGSTKEVKEEDMLRKLNLFSVVLMISLVVMAPLVSASEYHGRYGPEKDQDIAAIMIADALVVRPVGIAATVFGGSLFIISLPFSALGGNTGEVYQRLVADPARFTFARELGDFGPRWVE
jgi:hypothetical protein